MKAKSDFKCFDKLKNNRTLGKTMERDEGWSQIADEAEKNRNKVQKTLIDFKRKVFIVYQL